MSSELFISVAGFDRLVGNVWVVSAFDFSPVITERVVPDKNNYLMFNGLVANKVASVVKRSLITVGERPVVYIPPGIWGSINRKVRVADLNEAEAEHVFKLGEDVYLSELEWLKRVYPQYSFGKGYSASTRVLGLEVLMQGAPSCFRHSFLRQLPNLWLDLLRMGVSWAYEQPWLEQAPSWWQERFCVPWYYWYTAAEMDEAIRLIRLNGVITKVKVEPAPN